MLAAGTHQLSAGCSRHGAATHLLDSFSCRNAALEHCKCIAWVVGPLTFRGRDMQLVYWSDFPAELLDVIFRACMAYVSDEYLQARSRHVLQLYVLLLVTAVCNTVRRLGTATVLY